MSPCVVLLSATIWGNHSRLSAVSTRSRHVMVPRLLRADASSSNLSQMNLNTNWQGLFISTFVESPMDKKKGTKTNLAYLPELMSPHSAKSRAVRSPRRVRQCGGRICLCSICCSQPCSHIYTFRFFNLSANYIGTRGCCDLLCEYPPQRFALFYRLQSQ